MMKLADSIDGAWVPPVAGILGSRVAEVFSDDLLAFLVQLKRRIKGGPALSFRILRSPTNRILHVFLTGKLGGGAYSRQIFIDPRGVFENDAHMFGGGSALVGGSRSSAGFEWIQIRSIKALEDYFDPVDLVRAKRKSYLLTQYIEDFYFMCYLPSTETGGTCIVARNVPSVPVVVDAQALRAAIEDEDLALAKSIASRNSDVLSFRVGRESLLSCAINSRNKDAIAWVLSICNASGSMGKVKPAGEALRLAYGTKDADIFRMVCEGVGAGCMDDVGFLMLLAICGDREALSLLILVSKNARVAGAPVDVALTLSNAVASWEIAFLRGGYGGLATKAFDWLTQSVNQSSSENMVKLLRAYRAAEQSDDVVRFFTVDMSAELMRTAVWFLAQLDFKLDRSRYLAFLLGGFAVHGEASVRKLFDSLGTKDDPDQRVFFCRSEVESALVLACVNGEVAAANVLINEMGADPSVRSVAGRTLLQIAKNDDIRRLLRSVSSADKIASAFDADDEDGALASGAVDPL